MFNEFNKASSYYFRIFVILTSLIVSSFLTGSITLISSKNTLRRSFAKKLLIFSLVIAAVTYITYFLILVDIPEEIDFKTDSDYNFTLFGTNTFVEIKEPEDIVIKKIKSMTDKGSDVLKFSNGISRKDKENQKATPADVLVYSQFFYYWWKSIKLRKELSDESDNFSKTYDLNEEDYSWKEELVKFDFRTSNSSDKVRIKKQLQGVNDLLGKKNLYLTDVNENNIRIDHRGNIKIIDGEILTKRELNLFKFLRQPTVGIKNESMKNIYFNNKSQIHL